MATMSFDDYAIYARQSLDLMLGHDTSAGLDVNISYHSDIWHLHSSHEH